MTKDFAQTAPFFSANVIFINEIYQKFLENPQTIDQSWVNFFNENNDELKAILADYNGPSWSKRNLKVVGSQDFDISSNSAKEIKKDQKISSKNNEAISKNSASGNKDL